MSEDITKGEVVKTETIDIEPLWGGLVEEWVREGKISEDIATDIRQMAKVCDKVRKRQKSGQIIVLLPGSDNMNILEPGETVKVISENGETILEAKT